MTKPTLKEEIAEILEVFDDIAYRPNKYDFEKAQVQIIEAFNKILPEKKSSLLTGLYNLEENKGHNQCLDQIERAINE
jgi:hypothetical protein